MTREFPGAGKTPGVPASRYPLAAQGSGLSRISGVGSGAHPWDGEGSELSPTPAVVSVAETVAGRPESPATAYPYLWMWRTRDAGNIHPAWKGVRVPWFGDGADRTGQRCRVICRSREMNSAWIEFENGHQTITGRGGLRRAT